MELYLDRDSEVVCNVSVTDAGTDIDSVLRFVTGSDAR